MEGGSDNLIGASDAANEGNIGSDDYIVNGADSNGVYTASLEDVRYDKHTGLVPVVVQSSDTNQVLMVAYANREALKRTYGTGQAWFWSRSRQSFWRKGETSGNVLHVRDVRLDCDGDTVLFLVDAAGPACHTGATSCFYRQMTYQDKLPGAFFDSQLAGDDTGIVAEETGLIENLAAMPLTGEILADDLSEQESIAAKHHVAAEKPLGAANTRERTSFEECEQPGTVVNNLLQLWQTIVSRHQDRPDGSYTTYLFEQGIDKIAKKVGEEAVEVVIAGKNAASSGEAGRQELMQESADLLYHLLVLWQDAGITPQQVTRVLEQRIR